MNHTQAVPSVAALSKDSSNKVTTVRTASHITPFLLHRPSNSAINTVARSFASWMHPAAGVMSHNTVQRCTALIPYCKMPHKTTQKQEAQHHSQCTGGRLIMPTITSGTAPASLGTLQSADVNKPWQMTVELSAVVQTGSWCQQGALSSHQQQQHQ